MSEKMVTVPQIVCDFPHKGEPPIAQRLFIQDTSGVRYTLDGCDLHRRRLPLAVATPASRAREENGQTRSSTEGERLDARDAAQILGLSRPWIAALAKRGDIPSTMEPGGVHGRLVFAREDVEAYAARRQADPGLSAHAVAATLESADLLDTGAAAQIIGVHPSYMTVLGRQGKVRRIMQADRHPAYTRESVEAFAASRQKGREK